MHPELRVYWIIFGVGLLLSAFFSSSETALISLGKVRLRKLKERHKRLGPVIEDLTRNPDRVLSTILLGNNLVNSATTSAATVIAMTLIPWNPVVVATVVVTVMLLVFAEITPKVIAASQAERVSLIVAQPLYVLSRVAGPLVNLLTIGPRLLLKLFGITVGQPMTTSDDIKTIATLGWEAGVLDDDAQDIIHSVVEFGTITVEQIMVPRVDIEGVDIELPPEEVLDLVVETGHQRIPVYRGSPDTIVGILFARDLLAACRDKAPIVLDNLVRPPHLVSEHMKVRDLFRELRDRRQHLAVVLDEYGGTAGIVTIEDVLEELVGEMVDEFRTSRAISRQRDGTFVVSGQIDIEELNEAAGLALPDDEFQNLSGLLVNRLGKVPYPGEKITLPEAVFHVLDADHRRIYRLTMKKTTPASKP